MSAAPETSAPEVAAPAAAPDSQQAEHWASGFEDTHLSEWIQERGWQSPETLARSYQGLEKLQGVPEAQLLKLPADPEDAAWQEVYGRLGRPESPEAYEFEGYQPPGEDEGYDVLPDFRQWAHEQGLSQRQAQGIFGKFMDKLATLQKENADEWIANDQAELADLKRTWGKAYDENILASRLATAELAITKEEATAISAVVGGARMLEILAQAGRSMSEHQAILPNEPSGGGQFGLTPDVAQAKISERMSDTDFAKRYHEGDAQAVSYMRKLYEAAYPDEAAAE